ncbi:MFS transporter [Paenibacillus thalictri]|uniref:MFS transporter n=1 Tax=Paenibacillus thalictri TaxID=2527873 RepID=A0A4Q9DVQ7_9BACL|nr:MFS transporter [Paenibacillus thalictri]TBL80445.1 MFS transporter [Paenibacillus thalictri]
MRMVIFLLFLIMFVIGTDVFLISPLLPTLQNLYHIPTGISGWLMGAYALGYAVFALIAGPLSDGWDRKKVMFWGMFCFSITTFLCGYANNFWTMLLFRFLAGVSASFTGPQVWAAIPSLFPVPKITKVFGIVLAGLAVAQVLGIPVGSLLASTHWSFSFFAVGGFSLVLTVLVLFIMPSMKPRTTSKNNRAIFKRYIPLLTSEKARRVYAAYFLFQLGNFSSFSFIGKWITDTFHFSVEQVGYMMIFIGVGNLLGSLCSALIVQRYKPYKTILFSSLLIVPLFIILPHMPWIWTICIVYLSISVALNIMTPVIASLLSELNPSIRGTITSLTNATMYASVTLGAWTAGMLYSWFNGFAAIGIFSAVCFASAWATFQISGVLDIQEQQIKKLA